MNIQYRVIDRCKEIEIERRNIQDLYISLYHIETFLKISSFYHWR